MEREIRKYGVERCVRLLKLCGNPDKKLKIIHISGTNGKGSTAAYITSVLVAAGKKTGTFTSPWVFFRSEQFCVNSTPIAEDKLNGYFAQVNALAATIEDKPSPFEVDTATALYAFYKEGCEYAVIECGLGGRDDATNAIAQKSVAVFTTISKEHTAELGNTVLEICAAKSGIIKNCPVVVCGYQSKEVKDFFKRFDPVFSGDDLSVVETTVEGQTFLYGGREYRISMLGEAQPYNAATAIETCRLLGVSGEIIAQGLRAAKLCGRVEFLCANGRQFVLDGAHNPGAVEELATVLRNMQGEKELVFGCLSDKDVKSVASVLSPHFKRAVLFSPSSARAMDVESVKTAFDGKIEYVTASGISDALEKTECKTVVVCGSFTFIKEAKEWISKRQ